MTTIAEYVSKVGVHVDMGQLRKVDRYLAAIRQKMQRYSKTSIGFSIENFSVNQIRLNTVLGTALDIASRRVTFEVSKFAVDQKGLNKALGRAINQSTSRISPHNLATEVGKTRIKMANPKSMANEITNGHIAGAGAAGGIASRFWAPAIALAGGGYGLSQLNQRNQQVVAAQLQTQAVIQQANPDATTQQGADSFAWLRSQGNRIGFNYLEAAPDYNKLLSGLTGAGMSVRQGQDVFQGFSELARVNKLDRVQQQRVFRALSQVAGKGKLQSEELVGQLARIWPLAA